MTYHQTSTASFYQATEGQEFHAIQTGTVVTKLGQSKVRVLLCVTMTGEVLADSQHTTSLQPTTIGQHTVGHLLSSFAKRALVDDGIQGIGIDIGHRSKVNVYTQEAHLSGHLLSIVLNKLKILDTAQGGITGEVGHALQAHGETPLAIEGNHQRHFGRFLCHSGELSLSLGCPVGEEQSANLIFLHQLLHLSFGFTIHTGRQSRDNQLTHFGLQSHFIHHRVHPSVAILTDGVGREGCCLLGKAHPCQQE